ncbi:MAG: hypothetical protein MHMPM18_004037, partial [Marteilia pararefringens]
IEMDELRRIAGCLNTNTEQRSNTVENNSSSSSSEEEQSHVHGKFCAKRDQQIEPLIQSKKSFRTAVAHLKKKF